MVEARTVSSRLSTALLYLGIGTLALLCLAPMVHIFAVSLSDRAATTGGLVGFWPVRFTTVSYEKVLTSAAFTRSLWITVVRTLLGTALMMGLTILTAYPLSRTAQQFPGRGIVMALLLFAMLFSGGLIPLYMTIRQLGLFNSIWGLILPMALPIWNVLMLMNFFRDVPRELEEAAIIDGANHWQLLLRVHLPLAAPALATLTLFCAVGLWNEWFLGMVFAQDDHYPLQTYLRSIIISQDLSKIITDPSQIANFSDRSVKAAQIFVTTLPILVLYPFLQRYFVTGMKLGAVKG